jgi:hypothetical protein
MATRIKEKINLLENQINLKMEIRISYLKLREGLESDNKDIEKIMDFYYFCEDFFNIWRRYLDRLSPLINEFNRAGNTEDLKQIYAEILSEQYEKYLQSLQNLKAPAFLTETFEIFLDSVYEKQKYFKFYSNNFIDQEMKTRSDLEEKEYRFWLDLHEKNMQLGNLQDDSAERNRN